MGGLLGLAAILSSRYVGTGRVPPFPCLSFRLSTFNFRLRRYRMRTTTRLTSSCGRFGPQKVSTSSLIRRIIS